MAHDAFISYSAHDKPIADAACAMIEARGIRCWMAPRDVTGGLDWSEEIIDAISGSGLVVLIFSAHSNASEQVKREVERAVSKGLPVLSLRIEDVPLSKHMEYFIASRHWLDALTPPLEDHLQRLADTVGVVLQKLGRGSGAAGPERRAVPPPVLPQAGWERLEASLIDRLRPVLGQRAGAPLSAERPIPAMLAGLVVGLLGVVFNLTNLYTTLFPGRGIEAYLFTVFPWLQPVNLLGNALGLLGNVVLLIGVRWMIVSKPGGVNVVAGACRFLAVIVLIWFVFSLGTTFTTGRPGSQMTGLVTAIIQTAALAWGQIFVVWALIRWNTRGMTAGPERS